MTRCPPMIRKQTNQEMCTNACGDSRNIWQGGVDWININPLKSASGREGLFRYWCSPWHTAYLSSAKLTGVSGMLIAGPTRANEIVCLISQKKLEKNLKTRPPRKQGKRPTSLASAFSHSLDWSMCQSAALCHFRQATQTESVSNPQMTSPLLTRSCPHL